MLFKPQKEWPAKEEDTDLDAAHPPRKVMKLHLFMFGYLPFNKGSDSFFPSLAGLARKGIGEDGRHERWDWGRCMSCRAWDMKCLARVHVRDVQPHISLRNS
jgi:hypothetical protein